MGAKGISMVGKDFSLLSRRSTGLSLRDHSLRDGGMHVIRQRMDGRNGGKAKH